MKKNILLFYCFLATMAASLKAQEIRPMPADSAYGLSLIHILTLGLLCVPLVIRTTEEALKAIPDSMREGSRALGATKLQTIWHVILPMGMPNIITGLILALGRVSGETAPILFTCAAYFLPQLPTGILDQCI